MYPIATILVAVIIAIVVLTGGIVTIVQPQTLSYQEYVDTLWKLAMAAAGLGIGRGILGAGKARSGHFIQGELMEANLPGGVTAEQRAQS